MFKRSLTTALVAISVPLLGGVAIAVANGVDTTPAPVSVTNPTADDNGGLRGGHGADDPASHDANDDNGVDDPATHDINDDNGVDDPATHDINDDNGVDDPATHDINDDNGGSSGGHGADDPATHDINDDNGGSSGSHGADDG